MDSYFIEKRKQQKTNFSNKIDSLKTAYKEHLGKNKRIYTKIKNKFA